MSFINDQTVFTLPQQPVSLRRPATLIRAARAGQTGWRRERDLPRLLGREAMPSAAVALRLLLAAEESAEEARRAGRADYDLHRHVRLIIALLAEMRHAAAVAPQPVAATGQILSFSARGTARQARRA